MTGKAENLEKYESTVNQFYFSFWLIFRDTLLYLKLYFCFLSSFWEIIVVLFVITINCLTKFLFLSRFKTSGPKRN